MSSYDEEPWIVELAGALLRGEPAIKPLLAHDPFPDRPPRFVRMRLYRYELTDAGAGDAWWRRRLLGPEDRPGGAEYMRAVALGDPDLEAFLAAHRLR